MHNALFDIAMCRSMGLDLSRARIWDSMYAAYLLQIEPQGLKPLAYRWAGMRMTSYEETVGVAGKPRQLDYLWRAYELTRTWGKPAPRLRLTNDGEMKVYKPQPVHQRITSIIIDGSCDADCDPHARWMDVDKELRGEVEAHLGEMEPSGLGDLPLDKAIAYANRDADATYRMYHTLSAELTRLKLDKLMAEGMEVLPVFEEMQSTGMPASKRAFQKLYDDMTVQMERLQRVISKKYFEGKPFNPRSSPQTAAIMRRRGLEAAERTKTGVMSTSKKSIEHLRVSDDAIRDIMQWREYQHTRDMFAAPTLELMPPGDDVDICTVRCQLLITRTTTRRLASKKPNLLAMPKHTPQGKLVRDCYICPPGEVFLEVDLAQIETRFLAHESEDPLLIRIFTVPGDDGKPRDPHTETASKVFGVSLQDVTKHQRFIAKRVNFGIPYGVSGRGLSTQLRMSGITGWDDTSCDKMIREWLKLYHVCAKYFDRVEGEVARTGVVKDCWGMPRYLPGVWSLDNKVAAEARRHAVNHRIQGGAQGLLQRSMAWLRPRIADLQSQGVNVKWVLQVHDALLLQVAESAVDIVRPLVVEGMTQHAGMKLRVPIMVDSNVSRTWGGL
jgi:DNA polymerase-1